MMYPSVVATLAYVSHYEMATQVLEADTTLEPNAPDVDETTSLSLSVTSQDSPELTAIVHDLAEVNYFVLHPVLTITYLVIMVISTVIGNIGNMLVISAVCTYQKLRSKANVFIINLAIADYCVSFIVQGFSIVALVTGYGFFAERFWLCHAIATICLISCSCSLWNMAAIAINRYIVLCHRSIYQKIFSWRNTVLIAISLWIICGLLEMPNYFKWGGHAFDPKTMACSYDRTAQYSYTVFFVSVAISPPLFAVLACYMSIFFYVRKSRKAVQKHGATSTSAGGQGSFTPQELRLAKTLFIIFVNFLICWAPYAVVVLVDINDKWPKVVYVVVIQMAHTNSSLNSIIYAATNKDFRDGYYLFITQRLFFCCACRARDGNESVGRSKSSQSPSQLSVNTNVTSTQSVEDKPNQPTNGKLTPNKHI